MEREMQEIILRKLVSGLIIETKTPFYAEIRIQIKQQKNLPDIPQS
jgi:hypothetical protein